MPTTAPLYPPYFVILVLNHYFLINIQTHSVLQKSSFTVVYNFTTIWYKFTRTSQISIITKKSLSATQIAIRRKEVKGFCGILRYSPAGLWGIVAITWQWCTFSACSNSWVTVFHRVKTEKLFHLIKKCSQIKKNVDLAIVMYCIYCTYL